MSRLYSDNPLGELRPLAVGQLAVFFVDREMFQWGSFAANVGKVYLLPLDLSSHILMPRHPYLADFPSGVDE